MNQVQLVREKLDVVRQESINDSEQTIAEVTHRYERDKALLMEENSKLLTDFEAVSFFNFIFSSLISRKHSIKT